jgi:ferric-dicitrate binding protein FerR (iron transport regulator)
MNREDLFNKFLQRALTRAEAEELKALLRNDPAAGRALVEHVNEASLLVRVASQRPALGPVTGDIVELPAARTDAAPIGRPSRWRSAAIAASLAALAVAAWFLLPLRPQLQATVGMTLGEVTILRGSGSLPAETGLRLQQGDVVQTGPNSRATVVFDGEATRAELQSDALAKFTLSRLGKRIELSQGSIEATVAPQPSSRPMLLSTLHAEAKVLGTRLLLASEVSSTRLEVNEGAVQFTRRNDGQSLLVRNGFTATASPNIEFSLRPFLPSPWASKDIGTVGLKGQARFDGIAFRLRGAGQDTCCTKDQFHFAYQPLEGDGEISACLREVEFTDPEAKAFVMIRQTLQTASPQISLGATASGGLELEHRARKESRIERVGWTPGPCWVRVARRGDVLSAYKSTDGSNWVEVGSRTNQMPKRVYIGLGVTSYNHTALSGSVIDRVNVAHLSAPPPPPK